MPETASVPAAGQAPETANVPARHLVLVGLMGSGKTTVGRLLAERLGRRFLDSDTEVEREAGRSVREIFEADGEPAFRSLETRVLLASLAEREPAVVAAAGGAVLSPENRRALGGAAVVWLRTPVGVLAGRVDGGTHRPLLADDPAGVLARMSAEREPLYREVADAVVEVEGLEPEQVADAVLEAIGGSR